MPLPPFNLYNLYRKPETHLSSQEVSSRTDASSSRQPSNQSLDNQSSTAELARQSVGADLPGNSAQLNALGQFAQRVADRQQQFPSAQGQLQNSFDFGAQPGTFSFGFGPAGYNQNINSQAADTPEQGANAFQQNFPPFNFRTAAQLGNQFNVGQSGNSLPTSSPQQNTLQYTGSNVNALPGQAAQQVQGFGQFNGFQIPSPNIGQGFAQQFSYPNFTPGGFYSNVNLSSATAPSDGGQRYVIGFYGGAPNVEGSSFKDATLQGQQKNLFPGPSGFLGANFGQYENADSQLDSGTSQLGNGGDQVADVFSRFSFNPATFQNGGVAQEANLSSRVADQNNPPTARR